jgi:beta-glucosidase/6-phospho-beta-glucosidase/beta-galactosidase
MRRALALALVACGGGGSGPDAGPSFPAGFVWGTAVAPYQVEGGLHATDWYAWEAVCRSCSTDHADDGPDFWDHYAEDLDAAAALHTNAIRLGIEWARVFPTRTAFPDRPDAAAVARYHQILAAARARGLRVMVTLHHFSTPAWLADVSQPNQPFGWERDETPALFAAWAGFCAREFGADVAWWATVNEPIAFIAAGWLGGVFPPGRFGDHAGGVTVMHRVARGHALAYDAIHAVIPDAQVGLVTHNRVFRAKDPASANDVRAAAATDRFNNRWLLDALVTGTLDEDFDGVADGPPDPTLAGRMDFIGLNYYGLSLVHFVSDSLTPFIGLTYMVDLDRFGVPGAITDYGATIYPDGLQVVLDELAPYHRPILITENGLADASDGQRPRFLVEHLGALAAAIGRGADVRGYFHWSLIDNFEWAGGYCPRFGLYHVDYGDPARPRTPGKGAEVYRRIIDANGVPASMLAEFPSYPPAGKSCDRTGF